MMLVVLILISGTAAGLLSVVHRAVLRDGQVDWRAYSGTYCVAAGLVFAVLGLNGAAPAVPTPAALGSLLLGVGLWTAVSVMAFKTYQLVEQTLGSALSQLRLVVSVGCAVLFLDEAPHRQTVCGAALVLAGILVALRDPRAPMGTLSDRGVRLNLAFGALAGAASVVDKLAIQHWPEWLYGALAYLVPGLVQLGLIPRARRFQQVRVLLSQRTGLFALALALGVTYYGLELHALSRADASWVVVLNKIALPVSFLGAVVALGERRNLLWRAAGAAIVLAGTLVAAR